jgi:hypothetical protein
MNRIGRHRCGPRDVWQRPAVRLPEAQLSIWLSFDLVALFVDGAVVPTTEQREIRERGGPAVHDHAGCIARQTPGRFRGNAHAAVED